MCQFTFILLIKSRLSSNHFQGRAEDRKDLPFNMAAYLWIGTNKQEHITSFFLFF